MKKWRTLTQLEQSCIYVGTSGDQRVYKCPQCGHKDTRGHLYVSMRTGGYKCFRDCGLKGFVSVNGIVLPPEVDVSEIPEGAISLWEMPPDDLDKMFFYHPLLAQFIQRKKLNTDHIRQLRLYYKPKGKYAGIVIPAFWQEKMVGFLVRHLVPTFDKRKYTQVGNLKKCLFNYDEAKESPIVVVTESIWDALHVGWYAVAAYGSTLSFQQRQLLRALQGQVVFFFDANKTSAAFRYGLMMSDMNVRIVMLPEKQGNVGPSDMPREQILELLTHAIPPTDRYQLSFFKQQPQYLQSISQ